jgi:hypothetical protein
MRHRSSGATDRLVSPRIMGARHWLTFWFSVRARALRFRPVSRPSGFCSRACHASPFHCAARHAVKCTSGSPMTPGSAPPVNPAMRICSTHRALRCWRPRAAAAQRRRNEIAACRRRGTVVSFRARVVLKAKGAARAAPEGRPPRAPGGQRQAAVARPARSPGTVTQRRQSQPSACRAVRRPTGRDRARTPTPRRRRPARRRTR